MTDVEIAMGSMLLSDMPADLAEQLYKDARLSTVKPGGVIFREADPADQVIIVLEGTVKLSKLNRFGTEAIIAVQKAGDTIGAPLAFRNASYPVSCTALKHSRYAALSCESIRKGVMSSPDTINAVLAATYEHLHSLVGHIGELKANTSQKRIAQFLLSQVEPMEDTQEDRAAFQLPYDKVVIAGLLGITPETLSRLFSKLKSYGVLINGQSVQIANTNRLRRYLEA